MCLSRDLEIKDLQSFGITIDQRKECIDCGNNWPSHPREMLIYTREKKTFYARNWEAMEEAALAIIQLAIDQASRH